MKNNVKPIFDDVNAGFSTMGAPENMLSQFSANCSGKIGGLEIGGTTHEHEGMHV